MKCVRCGFIGRPNRYFKKKGTYKQGYRQPCIKCHRAASKAYRKTNYKKILLKQRVAAKKRYHAFRTAIFDYYGRQCRCCGELDEDVLTLDHINNDGNKHRYKLLGKKWKQNSSSWAVYRDVIFRGFPDEFQTLCMNCNISKHKNGGKLPHKRKNSVYKVVLRR